MKREEDIMDILHGDEMAWWWDAVLEKSPLAYKLQREMFCVQVHCYSVGIKYELSLHVFYLK